MRELIELRELSEWTDEQWEIRLALHNKKWGKVARQESQGSTGGAAAGPKRVREVFDWNDPGFKPNPVKYPSLAGAKEAVGAVWKEHVGGDLTWRPDRPSGGKTSLNGVKVAIKRFKAIDGAQVWRVRVAEIDAGKKYLWQEGELRMGRADPAVFDDEEDDNDDDDGEDNDEEPEPEPEPAPSKKQPSKKAKKVQEPPQEEKQDPGKREGRRERKAPK